MLTLGSSEQNVAKMAIRAGNKIPNAIANAPQLKGGLELYLNAFFDLDSERHHGMGAMPIPFSSIILYADFFGFENEQKEDLFFFIKKMDAVQLERVRIAQKAK